MYFIIVQATSGRCRDTSWSASILIIIIIIIIKVPDWIFLVWACGIALRDLTVMSEWRSVSHAQ